MVTTPWHVTCHIHTHTHIVNVPWIGSALLRILSAARVSSNQSSPRISLLQEGAGSVNNHHSANNFLCSLFGCFSMLTLLDCGMYRQSHSRLQCTPSIDFVTFSNVRGVAAIINEDEQFMVNHADIKVYLYNKWQPHSGW